MEEYYFTLVFKNEKDEYSPATVKEVIKTLQKLTNKPRMHIVKKEGSHGYLIAMCIGVDTGNKLDAESRGYDIAMVITEKLSKNLNHEFKLPFVENVVSWGSCDSEWKKRYGKK